jgi:hypothetical protein
MLSVLLLVFQYKPVQTWAAKQVADHFSKEWHTKVYIGGLYIKPFSSVVLDSMYVLDKERDTLVSTPKLTVELNGFSIFSSIGDRKIDFSLIKLDNGSVYLKKLNDTTSNIDFIVDYFNKPDTTKKVSKPWTVIFEKTVVNNFHFRFKNRMVDTVITNRINFDDLDVSRFSAEVPIWIWCTICLKAMCANSPCTKKAALYSTNFDLEATIDSNQILAQKHVFGYAPLLAERFFPHAV